MKNVFLALVLSLMTQSAFASTFAAGDEVKLCGILKTPSTSPKTLTDVDTRMYLNNDMNSPIILTFDRFGAAQKSKQLNANDSYLACVLSPDGVQQGFEGNTLFAVTLEIIGAADSIEPIRTFCGTFEQPTVAGPQLLLSSKGISYEVLPTNPGVQAQIQVIKSLGAASVSGCIHSHESVLPGIEGRFVTTDLLTLSAP